KLRLPSHAALLHSASREILVQRETINTQESSLQTCCSSCFCVCYGNKGRANMMYYHGVWISFIFLVFAIGALLLLYLLFRRRRCTTPASQVPYYYPHPNPAGPSPYPFQYPQAEPPPGYPSQPPAQGVPYPVPPFTSYPPSKV
ncbi:hypothetical protein KP509_21G043200, partial [Ceratopteris richardii]